MSVSSIVSDVLCIGGGVVGLTTALRLAENGASVVVVDRQSVGREASWAGAGMLPPGNSSGADTAEARLRSYSHELWSELSAGLLEKTGIDNGYRVCGALQVCRPETSADYHRSTDQMIREGIPVDRLEHADIAQRFPGLDPQISEAAFVPDFAQVRNPRHMKALAAACRMAGVIIIQDAADLRLLPQQNAGCDVRCSRHQYRAGRICVTAGAWSAGLLNRPDFQIPVRPIRGQMVQLQLPALPFRYVIELGRRYLVPRPDGLILVGSTEEDAGFSKQTTAAGVSELLQFACDLVPALHHANIVRMWAGLRPGSPDELPLIGQIPGWDNLYVGAGHFRSGLQMSPGSAALLTDLLLDRTPAISLQGLSCDRFLLRGLPRSRFGPGVDD